MTAFLRRPRPGGDPGRGLLCAEHFQIAYATNDIDRAVALFGERYGVREFHRLEGPLRDGGRIRVELAWAGPLMVELMTASGPGSAIYMSRLPASDGFVLRHHHLGYLVQSAAEWDALMGEVARRGLSLAHESETEGLMRSCFVDAPELGHYLEYILPAPRGLALLEGVPAN